MHKTSTPLIYIVSYFSFLCYNILKCGDILRILNNKYFKSLLAIAIYVLFMFVLSDCLAQFTKFIFKYDFYMSILDIASNASLFYKEANNYLICLNVFNQYFIYFIEFIFLILILYSFFKSDIYDFKIKKNKYTNSLLIGLGIYFGVNFCVNLLTIFLQLLLKKDLTSVNQANIESMISPNNLYSYLLVIPIVIIGPLVEELIFRKCIFNIIPNKILALIVSCLVFGLLHTISYDYDLISLIIITLPYFFAGVAFSYCYIKTDNVICSYLLHAFLNLLSFILILL